MDISRREFIAGIAITSGSLGFASGMATQSVLYSQVTTPNSNNNGNGTQNGTVNNSTGTPTTSSDLVPDEELTLSDRPTFGEEDAPVRMVYWNDYQCPFCVRFEQDTLPSILTDYVNEGRVQLIMKPLMEFGEDSRRAALSTHCVLEQDVSDTILKGWNDTLYRNFNSRNNGWASFENLGTYSENYEAIDKQTLIDCVKNADYLDRIENDMTEASTFGMTGTPFFVIYNVETQEYTTITGAQPTSQFETALDTFLNRW